MADRAKAAALFTRACSEIDQAGHVSEATQGELERDRKFIPFQFEDGHVKYVLVDDDGTCHGVVGTRNEIAVPAEHIVRNARRSSLIPYFDDPSKPLCLSVFYHGDATHDAAMWALLRGTVYRLVKGTYRLE